ncbi:MAG: DUF3256 family protein [Bacteroidota bacterium]|nr:DUF3256 family protein [Bacteroidota bacterium]
MKKMTGKVVLLSCLISLIVSVDVTAQTIERCFIRMPMELLPTLPVNSRKDLIDFYKNDRIASMPAALNGTMTLKQLSDDYLLLQTTSQTTLQLKLLPVTDSTNILAVVYSTSGPLTDSRIRFYTTDWKPVTSFKAPVLNAFDFLDTTAAGPELSNRFNQVCVRLFIRFQLKPGTTTLTAFPSIKEDIPSELLEPFNTFMKDSVTVNWQHGGFVK